MQKLIADLHTHTLASGHAYGTIREMAAAAARRHLHVLGITEHAPGIPGTADPFYYANLNVIPRVISGVKILHGSEINVLQDGTLSLSQHWLNKLDYAIVGIHCQCYENVGCSRNTENLIACMKHDKVCVVSHPDDDHTPLDYPALVRAAKLHHVALEVNNSSLRKPDKRLNCVENYREMLSLCQAYRVPVVVDSDAHDPSAVGDFGFAWTLIRQAGFDESLLLNADEERLFSFLPPLQPHVSVSAIEWT